MEIYNPCIKSTRAQGPKKIPLKFTFSGGQVNLLTPANLTAYEIAEVEAALDRGEIEYTPRDSILYVMVPEVLNPAIQLEKLGFKGKSELRTLDGNKRCKPEGAEACPEP
jgi:hypothetical protein